MTTQDIPKVLLVMKPVDGGAAMIGLIECPNCGETHYTTQIACGERTVFCGSSRFGADNPGIRADGHSKIDVIQIV